MTEAADATRVSCACADAPSETQLQLRTAHHVLGQTDEHLQGVRGEAG